MSSYKIIDLNNIDTGDIGDASYFLIEYGGTQFKIDANTFKNYILSGLDTGEILTTTNTATVTNKTFTNPKINGGENLTASSSDINLLHGLSTAITTADLEKLEGLEVNVQSRLSAINGALVASNFQSITFDVPYADFTNKEYTITASAIKTALGLPDTLGFSFATNVQYGIYKKGTTIDGLYSDDYSFQITPKTSSSSQTYIDKITINIPEIIVDATYRICLLLQRVNATDITSSVAINNTQESYF